MFNLTIFSVLNIIKEIKKRKIRKLNVWMIDRYKGNMF